MISARHGGSYRREWTEQEKTKIVQLYLEERLTQKQIACRFGVAARTIALLLHSLGVFKKPNRSLTN
jgi:transposase-like protein